MIKNKKGSRPEIKIVAARPMNDVFFTTDLFPKTRPNPSSNEKQEHKTSNGLDDSVNRRSTLPGKVREKQRPRSEIYNNGFSSLRPVKPAKVDVEVLKKDSKKLGRSKSLYSPKKPPRDLPIRPAPPPPSKQGPKDLQSPRAEQVSPRLEQIASISPTRPAPPAPIQSFNKKDPTVRSTMAPTQRAEMKDRQKRARSKSTSNFSEKQKPRVTSSLPRGKSFHSHGPRQLITPSPDANIVILTRRKSEDESYKSDVKLKSFGVKAARSTDDVKSSQTNNGPKILSNGNCSNLPSVSDAVHERQGSSGDISNAQPAVNGRVSLSDAIQSNAVYERLQQRHEDKTEIGPGQTRPETHDNGLSDADTDDVFIQTNVVSFSDAINSSPVLMKVKQKNSKSSSEEQIVDDSVAQFKEGASKCLELVGSSTNSDAVQEINSICATPKSQLITSRAVDKSPDSCSRQIEGEVVQNKDVSGKEINTLSKASDSPERRASQGRPLPPVVKPKPKVQKRPSIDRANQKSFEDQSKTDQVLNAAGQNEKTLKQLPPAIEAECVSAEMSNSSQLINTKVNDAIAEKSLQHSTCHVQTNEKLLLKDEPDSFPSGPLIIKSSKAPKKVTAAGSELIDASHGVKHGADNTSGIVEVADDSKLDKHPINTSDVSMPLHDDVSKTEVDKLLENSNENGDRKKSESEPESSGSIDSLTSIASQVTVIYNPDAPTTPTKDDSTSSTVVGPYESHPTKSRRQSVPEPYSSHRERRPKPAKTQSATLTLKTKNRKSKATIGRRLTSSPPSTPPPPPRTCSLDSESVTTTSDRPPVPPRAPSMYIQSDMRSLDALLNGANKLEKEKSPPPPRPSKPPMLRRAVTLDHRSLKTKADAAVNSSDAMITDTNSRNTTQTENNSSVKSSEKTLNSNSNPRNIAANGAAAGLSASNETQNGTTPTMGFSQKLDFFDRSSKKPKRPPVLPKQQSLDSRLERSAEERVSELSTEQLRKEGKEALELVSRLRKETTELKDNKKGKSPAPQKPKRPLSFSMENFLLSNASDMDKSNETGKAEKKKPPPKPGRPASFLKTSSFDEIKHEVNERPINESEASSTSMASFELRSKDAGLYENLDHLREGKNKPIKPVRTSSLKKEKSDAISKRVATSPNVPEKIEETCDNVEQAASNLEVVSEKHEKINSKIEVIVENKMSPSSGKNPEKLEGKCEQNDEQTKSNKNTPEKHTEVDKKDVEKVRNDIAVEKSPEKSIASDALSNQIDKLDKLILETSTVHNESVTESLCSIENADDQKVPSECGVEENSIKLSTEDTCYVSSSSEGSAVSKKQEKAIDLSKMRKSEVDNSTVGTVITKPLESATKQRVQTKNDVEIGEGVGVEIFPESSLPQRVIEEAVESKETQVSFVSHDEEIENICSKKAEESKKDQNKEVADSNTHNSIGEGSCSIIGDEKRGNADIQSTASTDRVVAPAGKEDVKSYTENPQNVNNKGNASLQESTNTRATKIAPTKPPRPRSFPKVINTEYLMKSGHITPHDNKQVPARPPLPNDHTRKTANHTVCQKSPPERPNKMPDLHQSKIDESVVTKRKQSPARTARPPIPLILRENSHDSKTEGKSDGDGLMDTIRKKMNVTDPHCIALYDYVSTNETDLNFKEGDLILLDKQIDKDWFHGSCDGRKGVFPANFVEVIVELVSGDNDTDVEDLALSFNKPSALGIYSFVAGSEEELSFKPGDTIELTSRRNDDWLEGICHGHRGIFPANFVVIVKPLPEDDIRKSSSSNMNVGSDSSCSSDRTVVEGTNVVANLNVVTGSATVTDSNVGLDSTTIPNLKVVSKSSSASITAIGAKQTVGSDLTVKSDSERGDSLNSKEILIESSDSQVHIENTRTIPSEEPHPRILSDGNTQADSECSLNKNTDLYNLSGRICTALADYDSDVDGDLCFKAGQDIRIISTVNMEWLKGVLQNRTGIFPKNFVKILDS